MPIFVVGILYEPFLRKIIFLMNFIHDNNYYFAEKYISLQMIRGIVRNSGKKEFCACFLTM